MNYVLMPSGKNGEYMNGWPVEIDSGYGFYSQPATVYKDDLTDSVFIFLNTSYIPFLYADSIRTRTMKISVHGKTTKIFPDYRGKRVQFHSSRRERRKLV
ncbi:MAG: hypothetical protein IPG02_10700 [Ignavibacteria bacterium]|nr:hypothetical protein [Ignavibacteria bacterium]